MKRSLLLLLAAAVLAGCSDLDKKDPYSGRLNRLQVNALWPEEFEQYTRAGVKVTIRDERGNTHTAVTDEVGFVEFDVTNGLYEISIKDKVDGDNFNGSASGVRMNERDLNMDLELVHSLSGTIIIKEIYCGSTTRYPEQGTYTGDSYIILHNNSPRTQYLDSLCFGTLDPYNSQATNVWLSFDPDTGQARFPEFAPVAQCIWQFPGDGTTFPLEPGEDAVVVVWGAIDHAAQFPLSVNLNREGYFVCYNPVYFYNTQYHPAPGDKISPERYLNVVVKTGQANAYTFSMYSPAVVIFRPTDTTIQEYIQQEDNILQKPGSRVDRIVKIHDEWIMDGVEVFYGGSSNNQKRLSPTVDAGYVIHTTTHSGKTLHRRVDEAASAEAGYEVLEDSNNSSDDFYERDTQSLHE